MTYKAVNYTCLCLLLLLVAVVGFIPTLILNAMSKHNKDLAVDIQAMGVVHEIYENFQQTAVAFDRYVRQSVGDADGMVQSIDKSLVQAQQLKESVSGSTEIAEMAENLVRNLKAFKSAVYNYHQEMMYDSSGDGLFQMEQVSLQIKSKLAIVLANYMQTGLKDIEKRNVELLELIGMFSTFSVASFIFCIIVCLLIAVILGRSFSHPKKMISKEHK